MHGLAARYHAARRELLHHPLDLVDDRLGLVANDMVAYTLHLREAAVPAERELLLLHLLVLRLPALEHQTLRLELRALVVRLRHRSRLDPFVLFLPQHVASHNAQRGVAEDLPSILLLLHRGRERRLLPRLHQHHAGDFAGLLLQEQPRDAAAVGVCDEDEGPAELHAVQVRTQLGHGAVGFEVGAGAVVRVLCGAVVEQHPVARFVQHLDEREPGAHARVVAAVQADDQGRVGDGRLRGREEVDARVPSLGRRLAGLCAAAVEALVGVSRVRSAARAFLRVQLLFLLQFFDVFHGFDGSQERIRLGRLDVHALAEFLECELFGIPLGARARRPGVGRCHGHGCGM